jgi:ABC-type multidrug transport system ATPase subunit
VIEAIDLTVRRRGRTVLDAVSFDVRPGQVTGVLGGTGAGKTMLLRRMVQLERGGGETLFDGAPYRALRHPMREVGLLLDPGAGHPDQTVLGQLRLAVATDRRAARESAGVGEVSGVRARTAHQSDAASRERAGSGVRAAQADGSGGANGTTQPGRAVSGIGAAQAGNAVGANWAAQPGRTGDELGAVRHGKPSDRIGAVLDVVGLTGQSRTRLSDLTDGMATRLAIAVALLGDPRALLFDCPERGLGPEGVAWLGALLRAFTSQGRAALVTGSDTETLIGLADRVLLLDHGYLVGTRTSEEVLRAPTGAAVVVRSPQIVRFAAILAEAGARSTQSEGACLEVRGLDRARVGDLAYRNGIPVHELSERFTGSDPADLVLAACSGRNRPIVPLQGLPDEAWHEGQSVRLVAGSAARALRGDREAAHAVEVADTAGSAASLDAEAEAEVGGGGGVGTEAGIEAGVKAESRAVETGDGQAEPVMAESVGLAAVEAQSAGRASVEAESFETESFEPVSIEMESAGAAAVEGASVEGASVETAEASR